MNRGRTPTTGETDDARDAVEPGSGGTGGLKWDDVAAGLVRGLEDPAYWVAVFCQDNVYDAAAGLPDHVGSPIIKQKGIKAKATQ